MVAEDPEPSRPTQRRASDRTDRALGQTKQPRGYRAGARVESGGRKRAELVAAAAAMIVVAGFGLAMLDFAIPPPLPADLASRSREPVTGVATPPALEIADVGAPTQPLAMLSGGLRWLDPLTGRLSGTPYEAFEGAPFADRDGSVLCVCIERPWQQHGATARVTFLRASGPDAATRSVVLTLETPTDDPYGSAIAIETALSPDRATVYVATLVAGDEGFAADIVAIDSATAQVTARTDVPLPKGESGPAWSTLRIAPDGRSMVLTVWSTPVGRNPEDSWAAHAFRVDLEPGGLDAPDSIPPIDQRRGGPGCFGEAYVGPAVYGALCGGTDEAPDALSLLTSDGTGGSRSIALPLGLGAPIDAEIDAVIDAAGGRTFVWSPERRTLVRVDSRTGEIATQTYARTDTIGKRGGRLPDRVGSSVHWSRFFSAQDIFSHSTIIGSRDGAVLYAIGTSSRDAGRMAPSTGILVIDPATLDLLDVWAPAAYYNDIAITGDNAYVVGLGLGGVDPAGNPARWQDSIAYHLRQNGRGVEIIGAIDGLSGWTPVLLQGPG